ncbi:MAG TPA: hypothetical protein VL588_10705 [Bdellovibrionota bacterium]|nr:hypothetical protein [Bdellovibrionota bacterium]
MILRLASVAASLLLASCASVPPLGQVGPEEAGPVRTSLLLGMVKTVKAGSPGTCRVDLAGSSGTVGTFSLGDQHFTLLTLPAGTYRLGTVHCGMHTWTADPGANSIEVADGKVNYGGSYEFQFGDGLKIQPLTTRRAAGLLKDAFVHTVPKGWRSSVVNGLAESKPIQEEWLAQAKDPHWSVKWHSKDGREPNMDTLTAALSTCASEELLKNPLHLGHLELDAEFNSGSPTQVSVAPGSADTSSRAFEDCAVRAVKNTTMAEAKGLKVEMRY